MQLVFNLLILVAVVHSFGGLMSEDVASPQTPFQEKFEASEHRDLGAFGNFQIILGPGESGNTNNDLVPVNVTSSTFAFKGFQNQNLGTYGTIIAIGGDFYGSKTESGAICSSPDLNESGEFFELYWRTLMNSPQDKINRLIAEMDKEIAALAANPNTDPALVYASLGSDRWGQFGSEFVLMVLSNFDHFGGCGQFAYKTGHSRAMKLAREAGAPVINPNFATLTPSQRAPLLTDAKTKLLMAYIMNAFSDHFLTDNFAAGHIRTPRVSLPYLLSDSFRNL
jgi:hypothetical protein